MTIKILKYSFFLVLMYFVGNAILERFSQIEWDSVKVEFHYVLVSVSFVMISKGFTGLFFDRFLKVLENSVPCHISVGVSWIANLGKYIPGKTANLASAAYLFTQYHVRKTIAVIVPLLHNLITILVSFVVTLPLFFASWFDAVFPVPRIVIVLLVVMGCIVIRPKFFLGLSNFLLTYLGYIPIETKLSYKKMYLPIVLIFCQCFATGIANWFVIRSIIPIETNLIPILISISAAAGALGLLAIFAPAGLGVREGIYLLALEPILGPDYAALMAVVIRLLQTMGDVIAGIGGGIILKYSKRELDRGGTKSIR